MRAAIGNNLLSKLNPQAKQYEVRDTKLVRFLVRVNPSGKMMYVCEYERGKRTSLSRVGVLTPAQARDKALAILGDAAKGIDPLQAKRQQNALTLQAFIENDYAPWVKAHRKAAIKTLAHIRRCFFKPFGNKPLSAITPVLIDQWRTQRLNQGLSTETVNRGIATFKAALSKAVLWGLVERHPLERFKLLKVDRSTKIRFLSAAEEQSLRQAINLREERMRQERTSANQWRQERGYPCFPDLSRFIFVDHMAPTILLSLNTGMRRGELFSLGWENVDFERAVVTVAGAYAKSGKTRHIPLNTEAL